MRSNQMVGRLVGGALAILAVVVIYLVATGGSSGHTVYVTVPEATGVISGQYVRSAGAIVGKISQAKAVDGGHKAQLKLSIDDKAWPLPTGTTMTLRWGGTISAFNRYIDLVKGNGTNPIVNDGGQFPAANFHVPVEYDQLLGTFTPNVRSNLKTLVQNSGTALNAAKPGLHKALTNAPDAINQASHVLADLDHNQTALKTLLTSTANVTNAIDSSNPDVGELVQGAGTTLSALASRSNDLQSTLQKLPGTFEHVKSTLKNADTTLTGAQTLVAKLKPGVQKLKVITAPLDNLLVTLTKVGPDATHTLNVAGRAAPRITKLANKVTAISPLLKSIGTQANPELDCIRPYTPDIVAFATLWGGSLTGTDGQNNFIRADAELFLPALDNDEFETPAHAAQVNPGLTYAFPRPPGYMAGQNWFLPQCGITQDSLNPDDDPEAQANLSPFQEIPSERSRSSK